MNRAADLQACRDMLRGGSRTFFAASLVLPRAVAEPAIALYAFCREADDAIDCSDQPAAAVEVLSQRLDEIYAGEPRPDPVDRAFAEIVARFAIPRQLPEALLEGLAWDAQARRYDTLSEVIAYAVRVAGTVGAMMSLLMRHYESDTVARACDLGIAMQLTNIARDVGEDAQLGRLYLPRNWLREAGIDPDLWLQQPQFDPRLGRLVARLLTVADMFYNRAVAGIDRLPASCRPGIHAARLIYAEIGREVERGGLDSVSRRAVVPPSRKLRLLAQAFADSMASRDAPSEPVQPEAHFLISAIEACAVARPMPLEQAQRRTVTDRAVWVIELFEKLERREQMMRGQRLA